MSLGPLVLSPRLVEKPWGGRHLAELGRELPEDLLVGESWDVADLDTSATSVPDPVSRVKGGPHAGATLAELIASHGEELLGSTAPTRHGRFPLLLKHLDAAQHLSVQVHPSAAVVDRLDGASLKTESWAVVYAEPGAELMLGVVEGTTVEAFEAAFGTPEVVSMLRHVPAQVGDVHHVPAGMLHALGAGVVVAEPQTPSDTTYRVYDWTREYDRAPRELHREQAMACLREEWEVNLHPPAAASGQGELVATDHYRISRTCASQATSALVAPRSSPRVVVVVTGGLSHPALAEPLGPGGVAVLPAAWTGTLQVADDTTWLDVDLT